MKYASIIILAYQRPKMLAQCVQSILTTDAMYPFELIIHDDGSNQQVKDFLHEVVDHKHASFVISNCGKNMGIEKAVRRGVACSSGDFIFKIDADITFEEGWLREGVQILGDKKIGAVGLLDYRNYSSEDERFHNIEDKGDYYISDNFVSSAYGFRRDLFDREGAYMKHDGWHKHLYRQGYQLAITKPDMVKNHGFGADKTIYVDKETGKAVKMDHQPLLFNE